MDSSDPDISFDDTGVCNHCQRYFDRAPLELFHDSNGKERLESTIQQIKMEGKKKPYDCLIGVSGGLDSTMVALRCKELGLRPLAIHLDNGWNTELSVHNVEKCLRKLNIDLVTYVVNWEEFRDIQLSFLKASVPNLEIPTDHAITALLFQSAIKRNIRYIISGSNLETEGIMPRAWVYDHRDYRNLKSIHNRFGTVKIKSFPRYGLFDFAYYFGIRRIKFLKILNYAPYNKAEAKKLLQSELGWEDYGGKHYESIFTRFFQGYILPKKFQFDKRRAHLSTLICSKQITREEALHEMEKSPYPEDLFKEDYHFFCKKFNLTPEELDSILQQENRKHTDFPSLSAIFLKNKMGLLDFARKLVLPT